MSPDDLFRSLRILGVQHLGQVQHAFFETSGQVSVMWQEEGEEKPGLTIVPERYISGPSFFQEDDHVPQEGDYCCTSCGYTVSFSKQEHFTKCGICENIRWMRAKGQARPDKTIKPS